MGQGKVSIAVAEGDGIGPEIMAAVLKVLDASGVELDIHRVEIGEKVYLSGERSGIRSKTWDLLRRCKAFLKGPITTPQGGGFKSLNVTIRTTLGLYANVRPCTSYYPFVRTKHPKMDVVIVRENEEDLYVGLEYRQTRDVYHALKIISKQGCDKIIRYAFEYACANGRKKVTCFTKDNILKISDGEFHRRFEEIAKEYPQIENEHWIVDIGAAKLADTPEAFDVIVLPNLYGDILSDVAAQITGSVGLAGSANIGEHGAMFEAIHGSAPRRAGQNIANPSGLLLAAVLMLVHIGKPEAATTIHNAWLKTLEDGVHTYDVFAPDVSKSKVGTSEFADAVIKHLGQKPETLPPVHYIGTPKNLHRAAEANKMPKVHKKLVGIDIFVDCPGSVEDIYQLISMLEGKEFRLTMIANRGVKVWPDGHPETSCVDQWRCRFMSVSNETSHDAIVALMREFAEKKIDFVQTQLLFTFDGKPGYTLSQDEQ